MITTSALFIFLATSLAALFPLVWKKKALNLDPLLSFCSGILIATAFVYMLPTAVKMHSGDVGLYILLGFLLLFILEKFIMVHPCQEHHCISHHVGISALVGLSIHCLLTGFSLGIAIKSSDSLAVLTPILAAVIAHKIPESFSLSTLLLKSAMKVKSVLLFLFIYCLMTPLGLYISTVTLDMSFSYSLNLVFAISTGTFIYIASSDILPQVHHEGKFRFFHLFLFLLGVFLILFNIRSILY